MENFSENPKWHYWHCPEKKIREFLKVVGWTSTESPMFFQGLLEHFNFPQSAKLVWIFTKILFLVIGKVDILPQLDHEQERDWWQ